ncbi:hypothetical protein [Piscinibacter koreensis]|uniref:Transposase n=1 Tax=Piscinibacter koreensis TaxID=2742824 RepID=A0A7Y6NSG6_9BURK|nr:hypothetical protein [Schlegelella koreensis]NUZ08501.1 hypothetical protein [Schlegelella koreensis]
MDVKSKPRRRHRAQFKAEVISACSEPGACVAAIPRTFDLNDNLVHQSRRGRGASTTAKEPSDPIAGRPMEFVAMSVAGADTERFAESPDCGQAHPRRDPPRQHHGERGLAHRRGR